MIRSMYFAARERRWNRDRSRRIARMVQRERDVLTTPTGEDWAVATRAVRAHHQTSNRPEVLQCS